jgi:hypothetical protein
MERWWHCGQLSCHLTRVVMLSAHFVPSGETLADYVLPALRGEEESSTSRRIKCAGFSVKADCDSYFCMNNP